MSLHLVCTDDLRLVCSDLPSVWRELDGDRGLGVGGDGHGGGCDGEHVPVSGREHVHPHADVARVRQSHRVLGALVHRTRQQLTNNNRKRNV